MQAHEIDLAHYNSPSFAVAGAISHTQLLAQALLNSATNKGAVGLKFLNESSSSDMLSGVRDLEKHEEQKFAIIERSESGVCSLTNEQSQRQIIIPIKNTPKALFIRFPGEVLALIGDLLNEKLPLFIFTNRVTFKVSLHFQIGYYEHQRQLMQAQVQHI